MALTPRQELVLGAVVEEFIASGSPVGSRLLFESQHVRHRVLDHPQRPGGARRPGLLDHPHTSAGRVPTDAGYRYYVDAIVKEHHDTAALPSITARVRSEIDDALEETAEALSRATELLAIVSAPSLATTAIRHIEVLTLQPHLVMVVVITTPATSPSASSARRPIDEGLAEFARRLSERAPDRQADRHARHRLGLLEHRARAHRARLPGGPAAGLRARRSSTTPAACTWAAPPACSSA